MTTHGGALHHIYWQQFGHIFQFMPSAQASHLIYVQNSVFSKLAKIFGY